jgi:glutamate-1-semialdehyde 2,1-aminomutase
MLLLAPAGPVVHSGTYSGFLPSVLGALATLRELRQPGVFDRLNETGEAFYRELQGIFDRTGLPARVQGMGARFGFYFGVTEPVRSWSDALVHDHELNRRFVLGCLERGVYFHGYTRQGPPGHAGFSLAHTPDDFATTLNVVETVARDLVANPTG